MFEAIVCLELGIFQLKTILSGYCLVRFRCRCIQSWQRVQTHNAHNEW